MYKLPSDVFSGREDRARPGSGHWHGNKTASCVARQCDSVRGAGKRRAAWLDGWIVWGAEERVTA
jgi:hypothetical protein